MLDPDNHVIVLSITRVPWKSTFHSMTLDFGKSDDEFVLRRHKQLVPRQAAATSSGAATSSIVYPAAPSSTPNNFNGSASFNRHWLDTSILPPDPSLGKLSVSGPKTLVNHSPGKKLSRGFFLTVNQTTCWVQYQVQKLHCPRKRRTRRWITVRGRSQSRESQHDPRHCKYYRVCHRLCRARLRSIYLQQLRRSH